jgi:ADP-ribose pyrophosphatase YjhB (NUDIX family)
MNAPKLVVTVALFTVLEDFNLFTVPASLVSTGKTPEKFGMGLFAVTKKSERLTAGSRTESSELRVLPTRAVGFDESVEQTAHKLLSEDLGITRSVRLRQTRIFDDPGREQDDRVISMTYWGFANLEDVAPVLGGKEQVGLELVNSSALLDELEPRLTDHDGISRFGGRYVPHEGRVNKLITSRGLGWGPILDIDHDDMVLFSWRKLRYAFGGKLDPFRFLGATALPEAFRLSDLRELNDVCRGERSQVDQFRRAVLSESSFIMESPLKEEKQKRPGKPATLYSLRSWAVPDSEDLNNLDN